jgi:hypothetical protein
MGWKTTASAVVSGMIAFITYVFPIEVGDFLDSIFPNAGYYMVRAVFAIAFGYIVILGVYGLYKRVKPKPTVKSLTQQAAERVSVTTPEIATRKPRPIVVRLKESSGETAQWKASTYYWEVENVGNETIEDCYASASAVERPNAPPFILSWEPHYTHTPVYPAIDANREQKVALEPHLPRVIVLFSVREIKETNEVVVAMIGNPPKSYTEEQVKAFPKPGAIHMDVRIVAKGYVGEVHRFRMSFAESWEDWQFSEVSA